MAKQNLQLVNFNKGLITEANPLIQPLGSTRAEQNFTLDNDGVRSRRLGMDYELNATEIIVDITDTDIEDAGINTFRWDLTGDFSGLYVVVVQTGNILNFFESLNGSLSTELMGSVTLLTISANPLPEPTTVAYSITQTNSLLVVATGKSIRSIEYTNNPDTFTVREVVLEVRDFFGMADFHTPPLGDPFRIDKGNNLSFRPPAIAVSASPYPPAIPITDIHRYNLTNQGWPSGTAWTLNNPTGTGTKSQRSPIAYCGEVNDFWPSNSDVYSEYVVASTDKDPKSVKAFMPEVMLEGELRNYSAPKGKAILELLSRGKGREEFTRIGSLQTVAPTFNSDITPDSASIVANFAGRVFYSGFSGGVINGDERSPTLNNYVAFSQLISYKDQAGQCYQVADPSSVDDSEIVATDGGIIRVSEATNIIGLASVSNSLLVFAENGVWQILGGNDFGFSAENYQVIKVSERGCVSPQSIVNIGESIMYWASDGIYLCEAGGTGFFVVKDLTGTTIRTFYNSITQHQTASGAYDSFSNVVCWTYGEGNELCYKPSFQAWYYNKIASTNIKVKGNIEVSPFVGGKAIDPVTVSGVVVDVDGDDVVVTTGIKLDIQTETKYVAIRPKTATIQDDQFTFSSYNNAEFKDWGSIPAAGQYAEDAYAFMQGSHFTGGVANRAKQSPYITFHFNKTEEGYDEDYEPINPSSCLVQTSWDWSNSNNSGKQGKEFQAYRFRRHYMPQDNTDNFDNGYETVVSKSKVRGRGKALSVFIKTEPLKNCKLIGWEQEVTINDS
jgi:hypothetical protein